MTVEISRGGEPSPEELAAIVAAVEAAALRPAAIAEPHRADLGAAERWRFSGRWWRKPVASRRDRPGY